MFDVDHDAARAAWEMFGSVDGDADGVDGRNGYTFEGTDAGALEYALDRALNSFYNDTPWFRGLQVSFTSREHPRSAARDGGCGFTSAACSFLRVVCWLADQERGCESREKESQVPKRTLTG